MGHRPVGVHDLVRWTTLPVGESLRALEDACEAGEDDEGRALKRIRVERGARRLDARSPAAFALGS